MAFQSTSKISKSDIFKTSLTKLRHIASCAQRLNIPSKKNFFVVYATQDGALWLNVYQNQKLNMGEEPRFNFFPLLSSDPARSTANKINEQIIFLGINPGILFYINNNQIRGWKLVWDEAIGMLEGFIKPFVQAHLCIMSPPQGTKNLWTCFEIMTEAQDRQLLLIDQYGQIFLITPAKNDIYPIPGLRLSGLVEKVTGLMLSPHNNSLVIIGAERQLIIWNWRLDRQHAIVRFEGISDGYCAVPNENVIEALELSSDNSSLVLKIRNLLAERLQDFSLINGIEHIKQEYDLASLNIVLEGTQLVLRPKQPPVPHLTPPRKTSAAGSSPGRSPGLGSSPGRSPGLGSSPGSFQMKSLAKEMDDDEETKF